MNLFSIYSCKNEWFLTKQEFRRKFDTRAVGWNNILWVVLDLYCCYDLVFYFNEGTKEEIVALIYKFRKRAFRIKIRALLLFVRGLKLICIYTTFCFSDRCLSYFCIWYLMTLTVKNCYGWYSLCKCWQKSNGYNFS